MARFEISGRLLARNSILNLVGQALPLLIGLASVPVILHGLGTERFGILVFTWTLTGAFTVFDLGLAGAVTKFVAEALGRGERRRIPGILWPAVTGQAVLGTIGAVAVAATAGPLGTSILNIPAPLQAEATLAFRIAGANLPVMLLINSFRGALEAAQRFDIAAAVKSTSGASTFLVPLAGVLAGWSLPVIIVGLLVVRTLLFAALVLAGLRVLPLLEHPVQVTRDGVRALFGFGGWITVASLVGFALTYGDRFVIGTALTMAAVAYYTVPLELISRLGLMTATLAAVLFPAFSTLGGTGNLSRLTLLFARSIKYTALTAVPVFILLAVFAHDVLWLWLGPATSGHSGPVLRILAVGAAFQVLAVIPMTVVQGLGRPDLIAKLYLLETPVYLAALWWLARLEGIAGAALAWTARIVLEGLLLLWVTRRMGVWSWEHVGRAIRPVGFALACLLALAAAISALPAGGLAKAALTVAVAVGFARWVWSTALAAEERQWMFDVMWGWRRPATPAVPPGQSMEP